MKKIALITIGLVVENGRDPSETMNASLALTELNAKISFFSLSKNFSIENHHSLSIEDLNPDDFDAIVMTGGTASLDGLSNTNEKLEEIILKFHQQSKPIGVISIASLVVAQILKKIKPLITLGETSKHIANLAKMNIEHEMCPSNDYITDRHCKLISTPASMNESATPLSIYTGIYLMIKELVEMA